MPSPWNRAEKTNMYLQDVSRQGKVNLAATQVDLDRPEHDQNRAKTDDAPKILKNRNTMRNSTEYQQKAMLSGHIAL